MTLEERIIHNAETWIDVPYVSRGRTRYGVDCVGFAIKVAHELNLTKFDFTNYSDHPDPVQFASALRIHMDQLPVSEAGHGHLVLVRGPKAPVHCGLLKVGEQGQRWLLHAYAPAGKVLQEPLPASWKPVRVFRFREAT